MPSTGQRAEKREVILTADLARIGRFRCLRGSIADALGSEHDGRGDAGNNVGEDQPPATRHGVRSRG